MAELGMDESDFVLLSVGEVNCNKNHKIIIEALNHLENASIHYLIAGQGDEMSKLIDLTKKYGLEKNVHFLGFRDDIKELLLVADVFCFPSKREGLGLAAIEAMASGVPVITSNIHGIKDYSISGKTGYSCNPDDTIGFADAIAKLMKDSDFRHLCCRAVIEMAKRFSSDSSNKRMYEIYEQVSGDLK